MTGVLLDTNALIDMERGRLDVAAIVGAGEQVALAAITAHELLRGVARLPPGVRRARSERWLETILAAMPIFDYDLEVARVHTALCIELHAARVTIDAHDQMVASTALALGYDLATRDAAFRHVPELTVRTW